VQPGESGKIPVKLNLGTHGGKQSKSITVHTNAPGDAATIRLIIQGIVWVPVDVQPPTAAFGRLTSESAKEPALAKKVTISSNVDKPLELSNVRSSNPVFRAETSVIEPGKKFELSVTLVPPLLAGNNTGKIDISTGLTEMPTLSVQVNALVAADVEVRPANLTLPEDTSAPLNRQLYVQNNVKTPMQLSGLETSNPNLKATLEETQPGMTYRLSVDVPAGYQPSPKGDKITFKTNNPSVPLLTVPVTKTAAATPQPGTAVPAIKTPPAKPGAAPSPVPIQANMRPAPAGPGASAPQTPAAGAAAPAGGQPPAAPKAPTAGAPTAGQTPAAGAQTPAAGQTPAGQKPPPNSQPPSATGNK
jgi:hypothetical protein